MSTDFFDSDLLGSLNHRREKAEGQEEDAAKPISEVALGRMAKQKEELTHHVAEAVREIETLRRRQLDLEKEKHDIEALSRKQDAYEQSKRDIIEKLERSTVLAEKEEERAARMVELLAAMRAEFQKTCDELKAIEEDKWVPNEFESELNSAIVLVQNAARIHKKALAKVDAASWYKDGPPDAAVDAVSALKREWTDDKGFGYWVKVGVAVSLPFIVVAVALFAAWLMFMGRL